MSETDGVSELAMAIRRHEASEFSGEDSPDEIIRVVLNSYIAGLNDDAELSDGAAAEQKRIREQLGLSGPDGGTATEELDDDSTRVESHREESYADEVARKQDQLKAEFLKRARRGR